MAIRSDIFGDDKARYVGCVIDTYEHNGYHDSDFYAVCWDEELGKVVTIEYDTTRFGGYGSATVDATEDVLAKVYRYYKKGATKSFDEHDNEYLAKIIHKGDDVVVVRGRKVAKGSIGKVFWIGDCYNQFSYRNETRVGLVIGEAKVFLPIEYVVKNDWEKSLMTGKARKQAIRTATLNSIPYHYRKLFN